MYLRFVSFAVFMTSITSQGIIFLCVFGLQNLATWTWVGEQVYINLILPIALKLCGTLCYMCCLRNTEKCQVIARSMMVITLIFHKNQ